MTEPTWTPWLENPGTGECPVPDFALAVQAEFSPMNMDGEVTTLEQAKAFSWVRHNAELDITSYRYAVPADLAWLAENVSEWSEYRYWSAPDKERVGNEWRKTGRVLGWPHSMKPEGFEVYTKSQWLHARRDLGYEQDHTNVDMADESGDWTGYQELGDDPVNHPSHYMLAPDLEAIDVIRAALTPTEYMGYLKGSILKYRLRAGRKGEAEQDIAKSDWYRGRALELEGKGSA